MLNNIKSKKSNLSAAKKDASSAYTMTDFFLTITVSLWGASYLFTKLGLVDLHPLIFSSYRTLISAPALVFLLIFVEKKFYFEKEKIFLFLLLGMTGNFLNRIAWTYGIYFTTISSASILWSTSPIFVSIFALFLGWDKIRAKPAVGILICFIGVYLIVNKSINFRFNSQYILGDLIALASALSWAIFTTISKKLSSTYSSLRIAAFSAVFGSIFMFPFAFSGTLTLRFHEISIQSWLCLLFVALVANALGHLFWIRGVKMIGPVKTACYQFMVPVFATALGITFLKEQMNFFQVAGAIMVLSGVYLTRFC